jgi:hemicentin
MVIAGGLPSASSLETVPGPSCALPSLPEARVAHSLSLLPPSPTGPARLVACGGVHTPASCIVWPAGAPVWQHFAALKEDRVTHSAATIDGESVILLGGQYSQTAEVVPGGATFDLVHPGDSSCSLRQESFVVLLGGGAPTHGHVDRYDGTGYRGQLPGLLQPRKRHACASFIDSRGGTVLLVAGGQGEGWGLLDSTELLLPQAFTWVHAAALPRALSSLKIASLPGPGSDLLCAGGSDQAGYRDEVLRYRPEEDAWVDEATMELSRFGHAVAAGDLSLLCPVDGAWLDWADWTACSVSCGGGARSRSRVCSRARHGGAPCQGPTEEEEACGAEPCPVDGVWEDWAEWGACSVSCGGGERSRARSCIQPSFGGEPCLGEAGETEACGAEPCPGPCRCNGQLNAEHEGECRTKGGCGGYWCYADMPNTCEDGGPNTSGLPGWWTCQVPSP